MAMLHRSKNLEIHVVDHCNLDCVACSHESPLMVRRLEDPDCLGEALSTLWRHYRAPLIKLLGGEPLLHPRISEVIRVARAATGARIRVVTNGTMLGRRYSLLKGVDEIHVSSYPGVTIPSDDELFQAAADLDAPITVESFTAFRWHRSPKRDDPGLTDRIFKACQLYNSWQCHTLRDGWFYPCPQSATWGSEEDGFDLLTPDQDVAAALDRLLLRDHALTTCATCLGSVGQLLPHRRGWRGNTEGHASSRVDHTFLALLEKMPDAWNECYEYRRTLHPSGRVELLSGA